MSRILAVQFRTDQSIEHDKECLRQAAGDFCDRLEFVDGINAELPRDFSDVVAVIFGGSGEFFLGKGDGATTWVPKIFSFLDCAIAQDIPVLGVCFGHQLILKHQGATIAKKEEMREVGSYPIYRHHTAKQDPVFSHLPDTFLGLLGHQETPIDLPDHIDVLGSSDRTHAQMIRVSGKKIWSTMFHPELTKDRMRERLLMYPHYVADPSKLEEIMALFDDAPDAATIIPRFILQALKPQHV